MSLIAVILSIMFYVLVATIVATGVSYGFTVKAKLNSPIPVGHDVILSKLIVRFEYLVYITIIVGVLCYISLWSVCQ